MVITRNGAATAHGTMGKVRAGEAGTSIRTGPTIPLDPATNKAIVGVLSVEVGDIQAIIEWFLMPTIRVSSTN